MAAKRTVRTVATFLVVLSVVASVLVAPVGATGDDDTLSTDDDDGVTVGTNDTSVSVDDSSVTAESGDNGVTVGADGVESDDGSVDDSSPSSGVDATESAANGPLPVNYSDIPWGSLPADVCSPPVDPTNPPSPPVNPEEPPEQWPEDQEWPVPDTVVNPNDPPGAPFGHCEIFDPTSPPFDPTNPPRDPAYSTDTADSNPQRYLMGGEVTLDQDGEGPSVSLVTGGFTQQDRVANAQRTTVNDGEKNYVLYTAVDHQPGTREGEVIAKPTVAGRSVTLSVICDGQECTVAAGGTPAPSESVPTGGGNDSGGGSGGANYSDVPFDSLPADHCAPGVDPTNPPSPPVNPEEPPEQWPDNQSWPVPDTVVNPNDPPGAPFGYCEIFDPANPPFDPTNPPRDPAYSTDTADSDPQRYLMSGQVTLDQDGEGPAVEVITGGFTRQDRVANAQRTTVNDGEKNYVLYTAVDHQPGTREGEVIAKPTVAGRSVTLSVICDDGNCTVAAGGTPAPSQRIPVGGGDGGNSSSSSDSGGTAGDSSSGTDGSSDAGGAADDAQSTADSADADHSTDVGADGTTASASAGTDDVTVFADIEMAGLGTGIPDAATATGALLDQL